MTITADAKSDSISTNKIGIQEANKHKVISKSTSQKDSLVMNEHISSI